MEINNKVDELIDSLIKSVQEIIKIKSIEGTPQKNMPFGEDIGKALEKALEISKNLGFKTENVDGYVGFAEYGEGEEYIGILGHLDVVPEGDGWSYPPYGAEIHDDKIFGRGTLDNKGPIIAALYGLKALKDLNITLSKKVRIIFGTNEESGSKELAHYLKKYKPPVAGFTPDGAFPIINGEKGMATFDLVKKINNVIQDDINIKAIYGGNKANMVPDLCVCEIDAVNNDEIIQLVKDFKDRTGYKLDAEVKDEIVCITSRGKSAHGSTPEKGVNAIMQLITFLSTLDLAKDDVRDFIEFLDKYIGMEVNGESLGCDLEDEVSGNLSLNLGIIKLEENIATVTINARSPVTKKYENMMNPIEDAIENTGFKILNMIYQKPLYFDPNSELVKVLQKVYKEQTGCEANLLSIGGGTYAKEMPNILAFGPIFPGKPDLDHQPNEYIEINDLILNCKIYANAIYELAK